jgi:hypothetical protein
MSPPTPPLSKKSGGCVEAGEMEWEGVSKCRSDVSKRAKRRFSWVSLGAEHVETVEAGWAGVSKSMSKECRSARTSTGERERTNPNQEPKQ